MAMTFEPVDDDDGDHDDDTAADGSFTVRPWYIPSSVEDMRHSCFRGYYDPGKPDATARTPPASCENENFWGVSKEYLKTHAVLTKIWDAVGAGWRVEGGYLEPGMEDTDTQAGDGEVADGDDGDDLLDEAEDSGKLRLGTEDIGDEAQV